MRIGIDYRLMAVDPYTGIGRAIRAVVEGLAEVNEIEIVLFADGPVGEAEGPRLVRPRRVPSLSRIKYPYRRLWYEHVFLPARTKTEGIDVFVTTTHCGLPAPRLHAMRRLVWVHDLFQLTMWRNYPTWKSLLVYGPYYAFSIAISIRLADLVIVPSQFTAAECRRVFPTVNGRIVVLPNQVEPVFFHGCAARAESDENWPSWYWLAVGGAEGRKNIPRLITAWFDGGPGLPDLVIVARPPPLAAELLARAGGRLRFMQNLSDGELASLYARAARLWQPSLAEGFGMPVVEALAAGTPVAVAEGSALDEVAPPEAPRFPGADTGAITALMRALAPIDRTRPDPAPLVAWANRFGKAAFRSRLRALVETL